MRAFRSVLVLAVMLSGCGGEGGYDGGRSAGAQTFSVSGTVTGLKGTLVLQGSGVNDIQVTSNGRVTLAAALAYATSYAFTVKTQPVNPTQTCSITNGTGALTSGDVTNVAIDCADVPLALTNSLPAEGTTNVPRTQPLVLTFSAALDAASLSPSEIHLARLPEAGSTQGVPVTLAVIGNQLKVTPSSRLEPDAEYLLRASTTSVSGVGGERLAGPATMGFRTEPRAWNPLFMLRLSAAGAGVSASPAPRIAADSQGNAIVVWNQAGPNGAPHSIWASRYPNGGDRWSGPDLIESDDTGAANRPDVAFDSDGNALAVWEQSDGTCSNIVANRYTAGAGWGTAAPIETNNCDALEPRIAVSAGGDAIAVWYQSTAAGEVHIWANRYVRGSGWGTAERIESNTGAGRAPQIVIDRNGNALAVWEQSDGTRKNIWGNRYVVGSGWGVARLIEANDAGDAQSVQITGDAVGNAVAVWRQTDGTRQRIWANLYRANDDWGTAAIIGGSDAGDASRPQIAIRNGRGFVVWEQADGARTVILARRFSAGSFSNALGALTFLSADFSKSASFPQIAVDSQGNAIAVWSQENAPPLLHGDAVYSMTVAHFTAGKGWGRGQSIDPADEGGLVELHPQVAIGANDDAFTAWEHERLPGNSVWVSHLD